MRPSWSGCRAKPISAQQKGAQGNNSISSRSKSPWALLASIRDISSPRSSRRRILPAPPEPTPDRPTGLSQVYHLPHLPSCPEPTGAAVFTDASTTFVTIGPRRARAGSGPVLPVFPPSLSAHELLAAMRLRRAATRCAPTLRARILASTGVGPRRAPRVRRELPLVHP